MLLKFRPHLAKTYNSPTQIIRVLTEDWVHRNVYCPHCGHVSLERYKNNNPAADFGCSECSEDYELKSSCRPAGTKIVDGAHRTMIKSIKSNTNANLFFLNYQAGALKAQNFFVIPKHFFTIDIIEKRKPLPKSTRRSGWVGCNILIQHIPYAGRIFYLRNGEIVPRKKVLESWRKTFFLRGEEASDSRGWTLDILTCIERLKEKSFTLNDLYAFERILKSRHPENRHIKDKIRQQLQILRDRGYLEFSSRGTYRLL